MVEFLLLLLPLLLLLLKLLPLLQVITLEELRRIVLGPELKLGVHSTLCVDLAPVGECNWWFKSEEAPPPSLPVNDGAPPPPSPDPADESAPAADAADGAEEEAAPAESEEAPAPAEEEAAAEPAPEEEENAEPAVQKGYFLLEFSSRDKLWYTAAQRYSPIGSYYFVKGIGGCAIPSRRGDVPEELNNRITVDSFLRYMSFKLRNKTKTGVCDRTEEGSQEYVGELIPSGKVNPLSLARPPPSRPPSARPSCSGALFYCTGAHKPVLESANPRTDLECASGCIWSTARATAPSSGRPTPGVVKQDKSSGGSVDTTKTRSGPQRVWMSSGERPIGAAKGKQPNTEALCQRPPHAQRPVSETADPRSSQTGQVIRGLR